MNLLYARRGLDFIGKGMLGGECCKTVHGVACKTEKACKSVFCAHVGDGSGFLAWRRVVLVIRATYLRARAAISVSFGIVSFHGAYGT